MRLRLFTFTIALTVAASSASAAQFSGSYTLNSGEAIEFMAEGTLQGDLDTVIIDSFLATPTFDGIAPVVTNPQFNSNTVSLSGDVLDLNWFGDGSVGFQIGVFFSSGPGYGNTQENLNDSFILTEVNVPEPSSLALLGLGGLLLSTRRTSRTLRSAERTES